MAILSSRAFLRSQKLDTARYGHVPKTMVSNTELQQSFSCQQALQYFGCFLHKDSLNEGDHMSKVQGRDLHGSLDKACAFTQKSMDICSAIESASIVRSALEFYWLKSGKERFEKSS